MEERSVHTGKVVGSNPARTTTKSTKLQSMLIHPQPLTAEDVEAIIGDLPSGVRLMGVSTLNGAGAIDGSSGRLGNKLDSEIFQALRRWADVVVVGAGTARVEEYGESDTPIAVITNSGNVPDSMSSPIVLKSPNSAHGIVEDLHTRGYEKIVVEGGPSVFAMFMDEGAFDLLHLTMDPQLSQDHSPLLPVNANHHRLTLEFLGATDDSVMFMRLSSEQSAHVTGW